MSVASLGGRYRPIDSIQAGGRSIAWLFVDDLTGAKAVGAPVGPVRFGTLKPLAQLSHPSLAGIIEIFRTVDWQALPADIPTDRAQAVVLAEYVTGESLHERVKLRPMTVRAAVGCVLAVSKAVQAIHERGGAHGAISPRAIVVAPHEARPGPVLTQLASAPSGLYSARERLQRRGPSPQDDSWALHAVLYTAMTANSPYSGGSRDEIVRNMLGGEPKPLASFAIDEPELQQALNRGLVNNPRWRASVTDLRNALERWILQRPEADRLLDDEDETEATLVIPSPLSGDSVASRMSIPPMALHDEEGLHPPSSIIPPASEPFFPRDSEPSIRVPGTPPPQTFTPPESQGTPGAPVSSVPSPHRPPPRPDSPVSTRPVSSLPLSTAAEVDEGDPLLGPTEKRGGWQRQLPKVLAAASVFVMGGLGFALFSSIGSRNAAKAPAGSRAVVTTTVPHLKGAKPPQPKASAPASSAQQATATATGFSSEQRAACVNGLLAEDALAPEQTVDFLCDDRDLRRLTLELQGRLIRSSKGRATGALRQWVGLGWYQLGVTAVVRQRCCPGKDTSIHLPTQLGECDQLQAAVEQLVAAPLQVDEVAGRVQTFHSQLLCLYAKGVPRPYPFKVAPTGYNRRAFTSFFESAIKFEPVAPR